PVDMSVRISRHIRAQALELVLSPGPPAGGDRSALLGQSPAELGLAQLGEVRVQADLARQLKAPLSLPDAQRGLDSDRHIAKRVLAAPIHGETVARGGDCLGGEHRDSGQIVGATWGVVGEAELHAAPADIADPQHDLEGPAYSLDRPELPRDPH